MGQFTERYEKMQTWAVLPAEPYERENDAERLDAAATSSPADLGGGIASVSVAVPGPVTQPAEGDRAD